MLYALLLGNSSELGFILFIYFVVFLTENTVCSQEISKVLYRGCFISLHCGAKSANFLNVKFGNKILASLSYNLVLKSECATTNTQKTNSISFKSIEGGEETVIECFKEGKP